jgi:TolA-binding protein
MLLALVAVFCVQQAIAQKSEWELSAEKRFNDALDLYEKRLYNPARTKFEEVLNSGISTHTRLAEESSYYRAMCALYLYNKDAEALLDDFSITYPASPFEQKAALNAADYYFNKRNYNKAKEWYKKVDKRNLKGEAKSEYWFKYGYSQYLTNEAEDAKLSFNAVKNEPGQYGPSAKYYYAHIAYEEGNYVTALENFQPLLDDASFGPVVPYYLAQIYYKRGEFDELIKYGEPLLERATEKRKPEIAKLLGEAYLRKEDFKRSAEYLEFYRSNGGKMSSEDHYSLGFSYYKLGRCEEAIPELNKITGAAADLAQNAYYHLGDCYIKTNNKSDALSAFKAASERGGNEKIKEDALFNYAKLNYELANPYGSAIDAFQSFLKKYPLSTKKAQANQYLANLYLTTKDYENALLALNNTGLETKEMREAYQKVSYYRGVQLYNATKLEDARKFFAQSQQYPINQTYVALAHYWTAESHYKQENYKAALAAIAAFEATPGAYNLSEQAEARYTKAYCQFMLEDFEAATATFRLFVDSKNANLRKKQDAELRLGDAYFMQSKYGQAISFYTRYLAYSPADADYALFQKALCQGLDGQRNEKIATLDKLEKQYPQSKFAVDGRYEKGATLLAMDKNAEALAVFQSFVKDFPQSRHTRRAMLNIGLIYRNTDQYDKSIEVFKKIVADYPATPEANEAIGFARLVYAKQNRIDEYVEWVETISFANIKRASLDSSSFSTAFDFYSMGNCIEAIKAFGGYIKKFPDGLFALQSSYYLGECAYKEHQDDAAEQALTRVVNEPRNEYTERSIAMLASINFGKPNYQQALNYYEQLLSFSEEIDQLRKARIGAMRCAVKLDIAPKALQYAEIILADDRTEPEIKSEAMLVRARSYWKTEDYDRAHQAYDEIKKKAKGEPQAEACFYIASIQNQRGEFKPSNETIFWMIDNLPSYQSWRFQSLLVMADNYYELEDIFQANYTLDFIVDANYSPEITEAAKTMKEDIRRAQENTENERAKQQELLNETVIEVQETEIEEVERQDNSQNSQHK